MAFKKFRKMKVYEASGYNYSGHVFLEMFENIAFVMEKHADASIPNTPEEWLDSIHSLFIRCFLSSLNSGD